MKFSNPYLSNKDKIELLQKWILVHSYLYYELNYSVVSDNKFDKNCVQLMELKIKYPKLWKKSKYYYAMKDFDGSTGYGFYEKLKEEHKMIIEMVANHLRRNY